jgi:pilus assembly protein FimV
MTSTADVSRLAAGAGGAVAATATAASSAPPPSLAKAHDDHLSAELSGLNDLDLDEVDLDVPDLVAGGKDDWEATDEADLDFELDLSTDESSGDTGGGIRAMPADDAEQLVTDSLDEGSLDLEDAGQWDPVETLSDETDLSDPLDLELEDAEPAPQLTQDDAEPEQRAASDGLQGVAAGRDDAGDDSDELDLLTETVIMDGLEFGPSASTASLSLDDSSLATKLDLAKAYLDMGDADGARTMLDEVLQQGNESQRREAEALVAKLERVSNL